MAAPMPAQREQPLVESDSVSTMARAKIVALEGPDRVGKKTQSLLLRDALQAMEHSATVVESPINDNMTHDLIRWMLKNGTAKRYSNIFQLAQFVNKLVFQFTGMLWLRATNDFIVLDRWSTSGVVYGKATGANTALCSLLSKLLVKPDITLVLLNSSHHRDDVMDVYESDSKLQDSVRLLYRLWAAENQDCAEVLEDVGPPEDVHEEVIGMLEDAGLVQCGS